MKRGIPPIALLVFALGLATSACSGPQVHGDTGSIAERPPEGQLPDGVRPTSYRLSLEVIPQRNAFSGVADIAIELDRPSDSIWMHGQRLSVTSIHAAHGTTRIAATWEQRTSDGVALVRLAETLPAGRSTLHIEYSAAFDAPLRGLYRVESAGHTYAFTQFESISARLAFPCFDEPRFKTPFEVTLTVPGDQIAATNTPIDHATKLPNGLQRIGFATTPPMPTYLVAWVVGPFDVVRGLPIAPSEGRPFAVPLRGIAAKGQGEHLSYALERAGEFVEALEGYLGIPYPYPKLDLVAVPDFAAGAMENVGLITFREWLLLLDAERATETQRRAFAYVLAHELAHQWFGNLVTMPWWDDIWLNEAFATWMGNKVVQAVHPEYRSDLGSLASAHRAMGLDSLSNARSIRQPVESNHDIKNAFDAITYEKGAAVLSMFEHWMSPDAFRRGIELYLRRHQGRHATSEDLLSALDEVVEAGIAPPFRTFLNQAGVPLVSGGPSPGCDSGSRRIHLSQERYLPVGSAGETARIWQIPFCIRHAGGTSCDLLSEPERDFDLPGCPDWWMPNDEGAGYFRFSMPPADWMSLRDRGFAELSDRGRMAVVDSLQADFDRGALDAQDLLPWFPQLVASPVRQIASAPMSPLRFMMYEVVPPELRDDVASHARRLYRRRYGQLGWRAKKGESSDTQLLREAVIRFMVMDVREPAARSRAARLGRTHIGYRIKENRGAVDSQLAGLALATAVQESGEGLFDHLVDMLGSISDPTTRNRIVLALGHAEDSTLSERALDLALDPRVRISEISQLLGTQFTNPRTRERAWRWLTGSFDALAARFGSTEVGGSPWYASSFCTEDAAREVQRFFEPRVAELTGGPRNLAAAVEAISLCAEKAEVHRPGVERAFAGR